MTAPRRIAFCLSAIAWAIGAGPGAAQEIVADGSTATTVTQAADQSLRVEIAPASAAGVSLNRYERFSVGAAGAALDNQTVAADAIVNEVTGSLPTYIDGPLSVLGDAADVLIANPNGVVVSGGRFLNMRELTLATGRAQAESDGSVRLSVDGGEIEIGAGGLTAAVERARLISKTLRVAGEVDTGDGALETMQGASQTVVDGAGAAVTLSSLSGVAVEVASSAFLKAGSIRMIASGDGPGVRLSGEMASAEDIRITADGAIEATALTASAARHLALSGAGVAVEDSDLAAEAGSVLLEATAGDLDLRDSALTGALRDFGSFRSVGAVSLIGAGDIAVSGGSIDGAADDITLLSGGDLAIADASLISAADIRFSASDAISLAAMTAEAGEGLRALSVGEARIADSALTAQRELLFDAAEITLESTLGERARLEAQEGGVVLISRVADVANLGGLIEGESRVEGLAESLGAVTIQSAGGFTNRSLDGARLGVVFGRAGDLVIRASGDVTNDTARFLSNFDVDIQAGGAFRNETGTEGGSREVSVRRYKEGAPRWWTLFTKRRRVTEYSADFGEALIDGERALTTSAAGAVSIRANAVANLGGDISGVDVTLDAAGDITNEARRVGSFRFVERCLLLCQSLGFGTARAVGGTVIASQELSIQAGGAFSTVGGAFTSGEGLGVEAETVSVAPLPIPLLVKRPAGLRGLFGGGDDVYWVAETPGSASFTSVNADLSVISRAGGGRFQGAEFFAPGGLSFDPDAEIVAAPEVLNSYGRQRGGVFSGFIGRESR